ncbi:helix-turn-helix transcriptional regulator [Ascidiimonas meishanensis]|uniref:helix-turn-helix transcriptional regulator n=1 Tax=Ascidiimonas meishanensis TaxID=3128903 RepID=UPI0039B779AA
MVNSDEFSKRLQDIIEYYDLSASSFADKVGVQRSSISHILSGRNKPSLDFILKTIDAFPEVSLYWLLLNKGEFPSADFQSIPKGEQKEYADTTLFSQIENEKLGDKNPVSQQSDVNPVKHLQTTSSRNEDIERIIIFFKDGSFKDYHN